MITTMADMENIAIALIIFFGSIALIIGIIINAINAIPQLIDWAIRRLEKHNKEGIEKT